MKYPTERRSPPSFSEEHRRRIQEAKLGHPVSLETREKIRQALVGKGHSPEHREKIRQAMLGRPVSREHRQKLSQASRGHPKTAEHREHLRKARLRQHLPTKMTSIERLLRDEFKKRRLKFEMHRTMFGRFQPDFVFESATLIVQADGDYWHSLSQAKKRDAAFNEAAGEGWTVWRFGGREIEMHPAACARAVARFIHDH